MGATEPVGRGSRVLPSRYALAVAGVAGGLVLAIIAVAGMARPATMAAAAAAMLAVDVTGCAVAALAARACGGAERGAFAALAGVFGLWAATRVIWLLELRRGGDVGPTPVLEGLWLLAAGLGVGAIVLLYVHHRSSPSWDGLIDGAVTAAAVGVVLWTTTLDGRSMDAALEDVAACFHLAVGAGLAVTAAGMFAWDRPAVGRWMGWIAAGVALALTDLALGTVASPAVDHPGVRLAAMGFGLMASASIATAAVVRTQAEMLPRGAARLPARVTRAVPVMALLAAVVALTWERDVVGALVIGGAALLCVRVLRSMRTVDLLLEERSLWADTDPLTGVRNRRRLEADLWDLGARADRAGAAGSVLLVDLDNFKSVNDGAGHAAGDALLLDIARALAGTVRAGEHLYRLGGDEFVVLLSPGGPEAPVVLAERLRRAAADVAMRHGHPAVSASVGIARVRGGDVDPQHALAEADAALYRAKAAGRNRVSDADAGD